MSQLNRINNKGKLCPIIYSKIPKNTLKFPCYANSHRSFLTYKHILRRKRTCTYFSVTCFLPGNPAVVLRSSARHTVAILSSPRICIMQILAPPWQRQNEKLALRIVAQ